MGPDSPLRSKDTWMAHVRGLLSFAASSVQSALSREQTPDRSRRAVQKICRVAGSESEKLLQPVRLLPLEERLKMEPQCKMGCAYCCYQWVRASVPEVLAIADYIRENFTEVQIREVIHATREYKAEFEKQDHSKLFALKCPLLVNNLCSIYEERPLICRGTASLDAELCRVGKEEPNSGVQVPFIGVLFHIAGGLREGIEAGLKNVGLSGQDVVFALALLIALEDPKAGEKFFQGGAVFASAIAPDTDPIRIQP